ncbi:hypothetical protein [Actinoplanes sp. NPDC051494]|uniref:hypothetical protein n=1 Tax=Actinoplanes sp. NPDC051494 TaxID=3363907 RepID=UPI003794CB8C
MTETLNSEQVVRCPICVDEFVWRPEPTVAVYDTKQSQYRSVDVSRMPAGKRADVIRTGYRQCPNPSKDTPAHFLPATYASYLPPLVIGLVGAARAGKTHLLTAMIREVYRGGLSPYGVRAAALDFRRHEAFQRRFIRPFDAGGALAGTGTGVIDAADILLLRGPGGQRPVAFFDVAGEDLESTEALNRSTRFLTGADAVIFVQGLEDPPGDGLPTAAATSGWSFELAVERLQDLPYAADRMPVTIAVTKSDRLRYVSPMDRWMAPREAPVLDATRIREQSRDVYAYLHHTGAAASLRPFEAFRRCTLHFVSASGGDALDGETDSDPAYFPRGVHPVNVLDPLISILAMTGMITGPEAQKVGMP